MSFLRLTKFLLLISFSLLFFNGQATTISTQEFPPQNELINTFKKVYNNPEIYQLGNCSSNIWRFIHLIPHHESLNSAYVLYLYNDDFHISLFNSRGGKNDWYFHVVLMHDGKILDFDYSKQAQIPTILEYAQKQLQNHSSTNYQDLNVRLVPALEYLQLYDVDPFGEHRFYYFLLPERSDYPELSVQDLLASEKPIP